MTDDVICLHFGAHVYICGHMIPSSDIVGETISDLLTVALIKLLRPIILPYMKRAYETLLSSCNRTL